MTADGTTNEVVNGRLNGHTHGHTHGHTNGHTNGTANGTANDHTNDHTNRIANETSNEVARKQGYYTSIQPSLEVAVSANDVEAVSDSIQSIQSLGKTFTSTDDISRRELLAEARRLVRALETPRETMIKHNWAQVSHDSLG
jgi:hypothetical protein